MMRLRGTGPSGRTLLAMGLTRENVERLVAGDPIRMTGDSVGFPEVDAVVVFFGETNADLFELLRAQGSLDEQTVMHVEGAPRA